MSTVIIALGAMKHFRGMKWIHRVRITRDYFLISIHSLRARESATAWTTRM